jgi:hypothetical protein
MNSQIGHSNKSITQKYTSHLSDESLAKLNIYL